MDVNFGKPAAADTHNPKNEKEYNGFSHYKSSFLVRHFPFDPGGAPGRVRSRHSTIGGRRRDPAPSYLPLTTLMFPLMVSIFTRCPPP
jgi:hypothetical protein